MCKCVYMCISEYVFMHTCMYVCITIKTCDEMSLTDTSSTQL